MAKIDRNTNDEVAEIEEQNPKTLDAFLAQNALKPENEKIVISDRFRDKDGKPVEWEIRALTQAEDEKIRRAATRVTGGRRGRPKTTEVDVYLYNLKTVVAAVVYPNLNDARLQDSYGVHGAEDLINKMLTAGEFTELFVAINELSGFDIDGEELEEQAKN